MQVLICLKQSLESNLYEQAALVAAGIPKSAKEFGDGVYKAIMNKKDTKKEKGGRE